MVLRNPTQFSQPQASWAVSPGKFGALVEDVNWELEQYPQHPARFLSPHALCCQVYTHSPPPGRVYFSHFADEALVVPLWGIESAEPSVSPKRLQDILSPAEVSRRQWEVC